jgi:hypothetical protein
VILVPYTVVNPGTVVVHLQYTAIADAAVMGAERFVVFAFVASGEVRRFRGKTWPTDN